MELAKIEALVEQYFEGQTSLEEEQLLETYFAGDQVAPHLAPYAKLFTGFAGLRMEAADKVVDLQVPQAKKTNIWRYAIAALVVVAISIGYFMNTSGQDLTQEQMAALEAFEEAKKALQMISGNLNDGIEGMAHLNELTTATDQFFK